MFDFSVDCYKPAILVNDDAREEDSKSKYRNIPIAEPLSKEELKRKIEEILQGDNR